MIFGKWRLFRLSLRLKLALSILTMTLPLLGMLLYNNLYAIKVVREQVALSYQDSLQLHLNEIDNRLNDADIYMNTIALGNDLLSIGRAIENEEYYLQKFYLINSIDKDKTLYPTLGSFFLYEEGRKDYDDIPINAEYTIEEKQRIEGFIIDLIRQGDYMKERHKKNWQSFQVGEEYYIIDLVKAGDAYLGAWIQTDHLLAPLRMIKGGNAVEFLFANDTGKAISATSLVHDHEIDLHWNPNAAYYLSGLEKKHLVVSAPSRRGNFSLVSLIPDSKILENLPYHLQIIWMILVGSILFVLLGTYSLRKVILVPLNLITKAMKRVREGDWSIRAEMSKASSEFRLLGDSFNAMMTEIERLRVHVFEEQLNKQREELHRLQLQVNPHFFLNALNIIYNLAKVKNHTLILQMTDALIRYFRYLFRSTASFVKLKDELEHTRNYLNIQSMRFPGQLKWSINAPEYLMDIPLPPLVIQSFVENSIKHAFTLDDDPIDISVRIGFFDDENSSRVRITIKDTGCGFEESVLHDLQAHRSIQNEKGEHTGIWNVQRRFSLLYDGNVSLQFENDKETGGAVVELILPIKPKMEEIL